MVNNYTIQFTKNDIYAILWDVVDPEIPVINIQEMGILKDVKIYENKVEVIITPSYTACPAMHFIEAQIKELLLVKGITNIIVTTVYSPAWTTDNLSESTKQKLKEYGIAPPSKSSCTNPFHPQSIEVICPRCQSKHTKLISQFSSTPCKALYQCQKCKEPFDYFKCL